MPVSPWAREHSTSSGWIRKMFAEGKRLKQQFGDNAVCDLSLGQPLPVSDAVRRAFAQAGRESSPSRFSYMANSGYPELRQRCADDVGVDGVSAASITVTNGAAGAIALALRAFVQSGDDVIGVRPYFAEFPLYASVLGSQYVPVNSRDDSGLNIEAIEQALTPTTGALLLNSPCNPSGHVLSGDEITAVAQLLTAHNRRHNRTVLLLVDEVYRRLIYPPHHRVEVLDYYEHTALARSFSKDLGIAGERIGYLVLHPSLTYPETEKAIEMCSRAVGFVNAPATAQHALLALPTWDIDVAPYIALRDEWSAALAAAGIEAAPAAGGIYLWPRSPWEDTLAFVEALSKERVLVTPGHAFGMPSHFRICFSAMATAPAWAKAAFAEVAAAKAAAH